MGSLISGNLRITYKEKIYPINCCFNCGRVEAKRKTIQYNFLFIFKLILISDNLKPNDSMVIGQI